MKISAQHVFQSKAKPKQGHLLLADPLLTEEFFQRAVILLIDHNSDESFGLVLNHPSKLLLSDLFEHIELDLPIYNGGPVAQEQLFYLHRFTNIKGATQVTDNLYFGGTGKKYSCAHTPCANLKSTCVFLQDMLDGELIS